MFKVKTSELIGPALDWAVAKCEGELDTDIRINRVVSKAAVLDGPHGVVSMRTGDYLRYSVDWCQGGPIIEREGIGFFCNRTAATGARFTPDAGADWRAFALNKHGVHYFGPTALIAAMRCWVASKLGAEVDVPGDLLK